MRETPLPTSCPRAWVCSSLSLEEPHDRPLRLRAGCAHTCCSHAAAGGPCHPLYLSASSVSQRPPTHGSWGCVLCILSPQQKSCFERSCLLPHVLFCLLRKKGIELLFARSPGWPWVPYVPSTCFLILRASYVQDRAGCPKAAEAETRRRVSVDGRERVPCEQAEVLSGYPDHGAERGPGRQRFKSQAHELDFRGRASQGAHARGQGRVLTQGSSLCRPLCAGLRALCVLELLL